MKLIIDTRNNINHGLLQQAELYCPWPEYKLDFSDSVNTAEHIQFTRTQLLYILEENKTLLSFASIGQDDIFLPRCLKHIDVSPKLSCVLMQFFTPEPLRGKGYGKQLRAHAIQELQTKTKYKYMLFRTSEETLVNMYKKRGAEYICSKPGVDAEMLHFFRQDL